VFIKAKALVLKFIKGRKNKKGLKFVNYMMVLKLKLWSLKEVGVGEIKRGFKILNYMIFIKALVLLFGGGYGKFKMRKKKIFF
jgi:hypothetical protein